MLRTSNGLMIGGLSFVALSITGSVTLIADYLYSSTMTIVSAVIGWPSSPACGSSCRCCGGTRRSSQAATEVVGAPGFEPATPCSQSRCVTKLRHAP